MTNLAPVAVFAFNRADHLRKTLGALAACPESVETHVQVFADGPRGPHDLDKLAAVAQVLAFVMALKRRGASAGQHTMATPTPVPPTPTAAERARRRRAARVASRASARPPGHEDSTSGTQAGSTGRETR